MSNWKDAGWVLVERASRYYVYETPKGTVVTIEDRGGYGWTYHANFGKHPEYNYTNDGWTRMRDALEDAIMYVTSTEDYL